MTEVLTLDGAAVERYADVLAAVAAALVVDDVELARLRLSPIAGERWAGRVKQARNQQPDGTSERRGIRERDRALTFIRDGFRCTACGGRAVPGGVLVALSSLFPDELPYNANYRHGETHPVYWALCAEADHVIPSSLGGSSTPENLRTIHAYCNTERGNALVDDHEAIMRGSVAELREWDGLIAAYPRIVVLAAAARNFTPSTTRYHRDRMRALGVSV